MVSVRMQNLFLLAAFVMLLHKVECWYTDEWLVSPFFLWVVSTASSWSGDQAANMGEAIFVTFIVWLFFGLVLTALALRGGRGPAIALAVYGGTFLLEWHHVFRVVTTGAYYPGILTAVPYLAIGPFYWKELLVHLKSPHPIQDAP